MQSSSNRIVALMIGRGGSSLKDKNILPVLGNPVLHWAAAAARRSKYIGRYYVSSDDDKILSTTERRAIDRFAARMSLQPTKRRVVTLSGMP